MKSYDHLYEQYNTIENVVLAIKNLCKHKKKSKTYYSRVLRKRLTIRELRDNALEYAPEFLYFATHFHNYKHTPKEIYDGMSKKKRIIYVPEIDEQVVHNMLVNILKPIFMRSMYYNSFGSIPKKGPHKGKKRIEKFISRMGASTYYCWKLDIHHYFNSIDHTILKNRLRELIHDYLFLRILFIVIDVINVGLPLGFYTSQWIANWFLSSIDHFLKDQYRIEGCYRYMDDIELFDREKSRMWDLFYKLKSRLHKIGLEIKQNYQLFRFHELDLYNKEKPDKYRFLDFMGFQFYRNRTVLRRNIMLKMTRKARAISKKDRVTVYDAKQMMSSLGYLKICNVYKMYEAHIKPFVSYKYLKRKVSMHDRRRLDVQFVA